MPERFTCKIKENENIDKDVKHLVLALPKNINFSFIPGQYVSLIMDKEDKRIRRPYSICNKPDENTIQLCIKIISNGLITPEINKLKQGEELEILGPLGEFTIKNKNKDLIFISSGTGIGPFRSMIFDLLENKFEKSIILIAGYRENPLYDEEFKELQKKHKNFKYKVALSSKGKRVQDIIEINKNAEYYICGLMDMITSVRSLLVKEGVLMSSIISEKYD